MSVKGKVSSIIGQITVYGSLFILFAVTFFPFWNIFVLSLNEAGDSMRGGIFLWPRKISIDSYLAVFRNEEILSSLKITLLRTAIGVPSTVITTSMLAYGLSKKELVGRKFINLFFIFTMYFSGGLVPTYIVIKMLGLIDKLAVLILPNMINVFWMLLLRTYMEGLPKELEESAKIDGANDIIIFARIILPVCIPVLATVTLFSAISHWNSWYDSHIYTYKPELKTLSAILVQILNQYQTGSMLSEAQQLANDAKKMRVSSESIRMAVTMVATLPIIIVYPFIQRYFTKGIMIGAIKG